MGTLIFILDAVIALTVGILTRIMAFGVLLIALGVIFYFGHTMTDSLQQLDQRSPLAPLTNIGMRGER